MKTTSPEFNHLEKMPEKFTADGENVNPEINISELPENTKSLILVVDDPDAKRVVGYNWIHWVRFNILVDSDTVTLGENSLPGMTGESTYKKAEYGGPNPPVGTGIHNYIFRVYALDTKLELPEMTPLSEILDEAENHILEKSELIGIYSRD